MQESVSLPPFFSLKKKKLMIWSDDDWLKKFSGKTLEENKEEEGAEPPKAEMQEGEPTTKKARSNPQVYMDIKGGNKPAGRIQMLLRSDVVPMTAASAARTALADDETEARRACELWQDLDPGTVTLLSPLRTALPPKESLTEELFRSPYKYLP
ncbi:uncharacterized protein V5649_008372 [Rhynchonycteris naso]